MSDINHHPTVWLPAEVKALKERAVVLRADT